ncbi:MAG: hypothetical protein JSS65_06485 [Armatimonadetes bacterium]|nr:hypothetical protein [Armatimonadota bacterium]
MDRPVDWNYVAKVGSRSDKVDNKTELQRYFANPPRVTRIRSNFAYSGALSGIISLAPVLMPQHSVFKYVLGFTGAFAGVFAQLLVSAIRSSSLAKESPIDRTKWHLVQAFQKQGSMRHPDAIPSGVVAALNKVLESRVAVLSAWTCEPRDPSDLQLAAYAEVENLAGTALAIGGLFTKDGSGKHRRSTPQKDAALKVLACLEQDISSLDNVFTTPASRLSRQLVQVERRRVDVEDQFFAWD